MMTHKQTNKQPADPKQSDLISRKFDLYQTPAIIKYHLQHNAEINYETLKNAVVGGHLKTGAKIFCQAQMASDVQSKYILSNPID